MLNKLGRLTKIKQDQSSLEVPSGQFVTEKFPVLTFGQTPKIDLATWKFSVTGLVDEEKMHNKEHVAHHSFSKMLLLIDHRR